MKIYNIIKAMYRIMFPIKTKLADSIDKLNDLIDYEKLAEIKRKLQSGGF